MPDGCIIVREKKNEEPERSSLDISFINNTFYDMIEKLAQVRSLDVTLELDQSVTKDILKSIRVKVTDNTISNNQKNI